MTNSAKSFFASIGPILVYGTGNVAWHWSQWLHSWGVPFDIFGRNHAAAQAIASEFQVKHISQPSLSDYGMVLFLASDDSILNLAQQLHSTSPNWKGVFAHSAGSRPVLEIGSTKGLILYPLNTFTKGRTLAPGSFPLFIESTDRHLESSAEMALEGVFSTCVMADFPTRLKIHAAATLSANFSYYFISLAKAFAEANELPISYWQPLIAETMQKAFQLGMPGLTGPASRGDGNTIALHTDTFAGHAEILEAYQAITALILNRQSPQPQ